MDLIDRQAEIDALEEPCKISDTWTDEYAVGERMQWEKDVKALNSLPTIDAVEIVRCKDCKHFNGIDYCFEGERGYNSIDGECFCECGRKGEKR